MMNQKHDGRSDLECLRATNETLQTINALTDELYWAADLRTLARRAVKAMIQYSESPSVSLFLHHEDTGELELLHTRRLTDETADAIRRHPTKGTLSGQAVTSLEVIVCPNMQAEPSVSAAIRETARCEGVVCGISIPLLFEDRALDRAQESDLLKSEFLATISHELRTPLNSILGFTTTVLDGMAGPLNEEQSRQLGFVKTSAEHLLALINDLIDLSRIEAGKMELAREEIDLPAVIAQAVDTVKPQARDKGLAVRIDACPEPCRLVSDDGEGITQEYQAALFMPFRQLDTSAPR